jgi:hypothetical protein
VGTYETLGERFDDGDLIEPPERLTTGRDMNQPESATTTTANTVTCDQAIFTSVRGPMGEGYRIIAASRGLKPEEKQTITRFSPSHDALCRPAGAADGANLGAGTRQEPHVGAHRHATLAAAVATRPRIQRPSDALIPRAQLSPPADPVPGEENGSICAVSFYALPTGRLCVAYSRNAGAEHTGRGGQRVYTISVVMAANRFADFGFDPFQVVRAMEDAGLTEPQLKPSNALPEVELQSPPHRTTAIHDVTVRHRHTPILAALLGNEGVVVNVGGGWLQSAEALMLSLPAPMRAAVGFSAGLRFSTGRAHRLQLLADENHTAKTRCAGQPMRYVDIESHANGSEDLPAADPAETPCPAWLAFVDRHWRTGNLAGLARRTSRPFTDVTAPAIERIGRMYNHIDAFPQAATPEVLTTAADHLQAATGGVEDEIRSELVACAQDELSKRYQAGPWSEIAPDWPRLVQLWRASAHGASFVEPLIARAVRRGLADAPLDTAEATLLITDNPPATADLTAHEVLLGEVVRRLAEWIAAKRQAVGLPEQHPGPELHQRARCLSARWQSVGPRSPAFRTALDHLDQVLKTDAATA